MLAWRQISFEISSGRSLRKENMLQRIACGTATLSERRTSSYGRSSLLSTAWLAPAQICAEMFHRTGDRPGPKFQISAAAETAGLSQLCFPGYQPRGDGLIREAWNPGKALIRALTITGQNLVPEGGHRAADLFHTDTTPQRQRRERLEHTVTGSAANMARRPFLPAASGRGYRSSLPVTPGASSRAAAGGDGH